MRLKYLSQQIGVINILKNSLREYVSAHGLNGLEQLFHVISVSLGYSAGPCFASFPYYFLQVIHGCEKSCQGVRVCPVDLMEGP